MPETTPAKQIPTRSRCVCATPMVLQETSVCQYCCKLARTPPTHTLINGKAISLEGEWGVWRIDVWRIPSKRSHAEAVRLCEELTALHRHCRYEVRPFFLKEVETTLAAAKETLTLTPSFNPPAEKKSISLKALAYSLFVTSSVIERIVEKRGEGKHGIPNELTRLKAWSIGQRAAEHDSLKEGAEGYWEARSYKQAVARAKKVFVDLGFEEKEVDKAMESI